MKTTTYTSPSELTPFDQGWLAGMVDGEGYFALRLKQNKGGNAYIFDLSVQVTSTDIETVERLERLIGGRTYGPRLKEGCKPCWKWCLYRRADVLDFCTALRPHLCPRRQGRVDELLQAYDQYARKG